jgi:hypothetical protein
MLSSAVQRVQRSAQAVIPRISASGATPLAPSYRLSSTVIDTSKYEFVVPQYTKSKGVGIVHDPWTNKGTGFPLPERDRLRLRGLVPPRCLSLTTQAQKLYATIKERMADPLDANMFLSDLMDRNETLFFRLLIDHLAELSPIVYTPTVGLVCQRFGSYFRRARGMYFSSQDKGLMGSMVYNWPREDVEVVVVTVSDCFLL